MAHRKILPFELEWLHFLRNQAGSARQQERCRRASQTRRGTVTRSTENGRIFRCAIYARKSSEEGLEQDFNSLHAQRESCEAFIASQKREGWALVGEMYDDGGFSGATMERPAFQRLLSDVSGGKIDVVVVYKVDRLT